MLKIQKDKILYYPYKESKRFRNLTKIKGGIFKKMNDDVEIAANVTFGDFFHLLIKEKNLIDLIFSASLCSFPFASLIQDFKKKTESLDDEDQFLEIFWHVDFDEDELSVYPGIQLIEIKKGNKNEKITFGLDFLSLSALKEYPLKLNENLEIIDYKNPLKNSDLILKTTKKYTLYEITDAIFYELTFYGTPQMRDKEGESILEQVKDIETAKEKN